MPSIKPTGGSRVQSTETPSVQEQPKATESKESKPEAPPLSKEKQAELKQAMHADSKFSEATIRAKLESSAEPEALKAEKGLAEAAAKAAGKLAGKAAAKAGKAAPKAAPAAGPVDDPERLKKIETLLEKSPTGKAAMKKAKEAGTEFKTGPAGKGSYNSGKKIVVDSNHSTARAALTYVHEAHHASVPNPDPKKTTRDDYVKALLKEEVDGTVLSIETKNELKSAGVDTKGITYPLEKEYNKAKKKAIRAAKRKNPKLSSEELEKIGREAGRKRVEDGFKNGDVVTSNTKEKYPDYYGKRWDKHNPKK